MMKKNSLCYSRKVSKKKSALAIFTLLLFLFGISFVAQDAHSWNLDGNNYSSGITVLSGGGEMTANSTNYQSDMVTAQTATGNTNSSLFKTVLGFFFTIGEWFQENLNPLTPNLILPEDESNFNTASVDFSFTTTDPEEDPITYYLYINEILNVTTLDDNATVVFGDGRYAWNVKAGDGDGYSGLSETREFLVDMTLPGIGFTGQTLENDTRKAFSKNYAEVNITTNDDFNNSVVMDWDSTLTLWQRFDGNMLDSSSYGNDGSCTNCPAVTYAAKRGRGYDFDGINDRITIADDTSMNSENFTLILWAKVNKDAHSHVLQLGTNANYPGLHFYPGVRKLDFYTRNLGSDNLFPAYALTLERWYHVAIVKNGLHLYFYVDGDSAGDVVVASFPAFSGVKYIGYRSDNAFPLNGSIDELQLYSRVLSLQEIKADYKANLNKYFKNFTGLDSGVHEYIAYAVDEGGNMNSTEERTININYLPSSPDVLLSSETKWNLTDEDLSVSITNGLDSDSDPFVNITDWRVEETSITVLNMPFETNSTVIAKDYSTFENDGTISNAVWTANGKVGGAYGFDGTSSYITGPSDSELSPENMTITAWINASSAKAEQTIVSKTQTGGPWKGYRLGINSGKLLFWTSSGAGSNAQSTGSVANNQWRFVALTFNNATKHYRFYIDSNIDSEGTKDQGVLDSGTNIIIGKENAVTRYMQGGIDELQIYNRILSREEIEEIRQTGLAGHHLQDIVHNETSIGDNWTVSVTPNDGYDDGATVLSNSLQVTENQAPGKVTLLAPSNGNDSSVNRTQVLSWEAPTDFEDDSLTYDINITRITFTGELGCSVNSIIQTGITGVSYTTQELCVDDWYEWKVRAYDGEDYGEWSDIWNFSVQSYISVSLVWDTVNFLGLYVGDTKNTTDGDVIPFKVENAGNVKLNFTIYGNQSLWIREYADLNTSYFQFKANNSDELLSFETGESQMDWMNVTDYEINLLKMLDYNNSKDTALIDVLVRVPEDEPGGSKSSTLVMTSSLG